MTGSKYPRGRQPWSAWGGTPKVGMVVARLAPQLNISTNGLLIRRSTNKHNGLRNLCAENVR